MAFALERFTLIRPHPEPVEGRGRRTLCSQNPLSFDKLRMRILGEDYRTSACIAPSSPSSVSGNMRPAILNAIVMDQEPWHIA